MNNEKIKFQSQHGDIIVETYDNKPIVRSPNKQENYVQRKFGDALNVIKSVGNEVVQKVNEISDAPDEVKVEIGVKFSAETGAIVAKSSAEGTIKLTLNWKKSN